MKDVFKKTIQDWRIYEGTKVENPEDAKQFVLDVKIEGGQLYIDVSDGKDGGDYMGVIVEINEGKPCIHISTEEGGDNILHAFSVDGNLIATPDSGVKAVTADVSRYTYNESNSILFR